VVDGPVLADSENFDSRLISTTLLSVPSCVGLALGGLRLEFDLVEETSAEVLDVPGVHIVLRQKQFSAVFPCLHWTNNFSVNEFFD